MSSRLLPSAVVIASFIPLPAFAEQLGFFAGMDISGSAAYGSSSTTNGGAPIAGGGVVGNVKFGRGVGIGGHIGYRFDPAWSIFISYQHVRNDVSWDANFAAYGVTSDFAGTAISNGILGNVAYDLAVSDATSLRLSAGLGVTSNSFSNVVETDKATGLFVSVVADEAHLSPMARIGAGLRHKVLANVELGVDASATYAGGFETGNTRRGNLGVTSIMPYRIDDVWRADVSASLRVAF